jgi:hypothetical protein
MEDFLVCLYSGVNSEEVHLVSPGEVYSLNGPPLCGGNSHMRCLKYR